MSMISRVSLEGVDGVAKGVPWGSSAGALPCLAERLQECMDTNDNHEVQGPIRFVAPPRKPSTSKKNSLCPGWAGRASRRPSASEVVVVEKGH